MSDRDPLADRLDDAERKVLAAEANRAKTAEAYAADLAWLNEHVPNAYDAFVTTLKDRIEKISTDVKLSARRYSWRQGGTRDLSVTLGRDSIMDIGYTFGNPLKVAPQIQVKISPTSYGTADDVKIHVDPVYDKGNVGWKSGGRGYTDNELVNWLLGTLLDFDDHIRSGR